MSDTIAPFVDLHNHRAFPCRAVRTRAQPFSSAGNHSIEARPSANHKSDYKLTCRFFGFITNVRHITLPFRVLRRHPLGPTTIIVPFVSQSPRPLFFPVPGASEIPLIFQPYSPVSSLPGLAARYEPRLICHFRPVNHSWIVPLECERALNHRDTRTSYFVP